MSLLPKFSLFMYQFFSIPMVDFHRHWMSVWLDLNIQFSAERSLQFTPHPIIRKYFSSSPLENHGSNLRSRIHINQTKVFTQLCTRYFGFFLTPLLPTVYIYSQRSHTCMQRQRQSKAKIWKFPWLATFVDNHIGQAWLPWRFGMKLFRFSHSITILDWPTQNLWLYCSIYGKGNFCIFKFSGRGHKRSKLAILSLQKK